MALPMTFDLHLLTGEPTLFSPVGLPAAVLAQAIDPRIQSVPANWLSQSQAIYGHDFLLDGEGDPRIAVMARALATDFGGQSQPCLILPSLMDEGRHDAALVALVKLVDALARLGEACRLVLYAVSLPDWHDPSLLLQALVVKMRAFGLQADLAEKSILSPVAGSALNDLMQHNLLAFSVAQEIIPAAAELGLRVTELSQLASQCAPWLSAWGTRGLVPTNPMSPEHLHRLAETVLHCILTTHPQLTWEPQPDPSAKKSSP